MSIVIKFEEIMKIVIRNKSDKELLAIQIESTVLTNSSAERSLCNLPTSTNKAYKLPTR